MIKSPLNYIGGKGKLLNQIIPLFPQKINKFVDLFAGGFNVGINIEANIIYCNDQIFQIIDLYKIIKTVEIKTVLEHINMQIEKFNLSKENEDGFKKLREFYNKYKNPLDLYVLICFSFNHQVRFNSNYEYNNPFGKNRSCYNVNIKNKLIDFKNRIDKINIEFSSLDFREFSIENFNQDDFFYCDPPYLISTGTYNDGKRGFSGWGISEEMSLLNLLDNLNTKNIKFALSNVIKHKGLINEELDKWRKKYNTHFIDSDYSNSNYNLNKEDKHVTIEVLITNY